MAEPQLLVYEQTNGRTSKLDWKALLLLHDNSHSALDRHIGSIVCDMKSAYRHSFSLDVQVCSFHRLTLVKDVVTLIRNHNIWPVFLAR